MIKLLATAPVDGWAFVAEGQKTSLLKPPYRQVDFVSVSSEFVEKAVGHYGFAASTLVFTNTNELVAHLQQTAAEVSKELVDGASDDANPFRFVTLDLLEDYVIKIERMIAVERRYASGERAATLLLSAKVLESHPEKREQILRVLRSAQTAERNQRKNIADLGLAAVLQRFPRAASRFGEASLLKLAQTICADRQIVRVGS